MSTKPMRTPIIPIDPSDWTLEDWRDLHKGIEEIKQRIAARYAPRDNMIGIASPPVDNAHVAPGCEQFAENTPDQKELGYLWRRLFAIYKVNGGILDFKEWQERERELAMETLKGK